MSRAYLRGFFRRDLLRSPYHQQLFYLLGSKSSLRYVLLNILLDWFLVPRSYIWGHARTGVDQLRWGTYLFSPLFIASMPHVHRFSLDHQRKTLRANSNPSSLHSYPSPSFSSSLDFWAMTIDTSHDTTLRSLNLVSPQSIAVFLYTFLRTCSSALTRTFSHSGHRPYRLEPLWNNLCIQAGPPTLRRGRRVRL